LRPSNFLELSSIPDKLKQLIGYAVLAPSAHNTQPWLFRVVDKTIDIIADRSRALPVVDAEDKGLLISCGTCAGILTQALEATGFVFKRTFLPDPSFPDLIARFRITAEKEPKENWINDLNSIRLRRSARAGFITQPLPLAVAEKLINQRDESGVRLAFWQDAQSESAVLSSVVHADRELSSDKHYRRENASWINPIRARTHDGIPTDSTQIAPTEEIWSPDLSFASSGDRTTLLGAIFTEGDRPLDWIKAGSLLADSLIQASKQGLSAAITTHLIAFPGMKNQFRAVSSPKEHIQVLIRVGFAKRCPLTPRRPIHDVMLQPGYAG